MVECYICKKTGLKLKDTVAAFKDGKSVLVCRECAGKELGHQDTEMYFKKLK